MGEAGLGAAGGAVDRGERYEDAAARKLFEETGLNGNLVGPCIWTRKFVFPWKGATYERSERYFPVHVKNASDVNYTGDDGVDLAKIGYAKWWKVDEITASNESFLPPEIAKHLENYLPLGLPSASVDLGVDSILTAIFRPTARVVVLNERDEVLLFRVRAERRDLWITPGGGLDPGESWEECARRELLEETGIDVDRLGPYVWKGTVIISHSGRNYLLDQRFFMAKVGGVPEVDISGLDQIEAGMTVSHKWWSLDELVRTSDEMRPHGIADLLPPLIAGKIPPEPLEIEIAPVDSAPQRFEK